MEDNQIISILLDRLNNDELWFTQKTDPTWEEPAHYYKLDEYGDLLDTSKKQIIKEIKSYIGDGAIEIDDAIDLWIQNACIEYRVAYKSLLVTKFKDKQAIDGIEAYTSNVLNENKLLREHTESWLKSMDKDSHWVKPFVDYFKQEYPNENINKVLLEVVEGGWEPCVAFIETDNTTYRVYIAELSGGMYMSDNNSIKVAKSGYKSEYDSIEENKKVTEAKSIKMSVCPHCGKKELKYDNDKKPDVVEYNDYVSYPWHCNSCGKDGKEIFSLDFIGHDVYREDDIDSTAGTDFLEKTESKHIKIESRKSRLEEENNKSATLISDMFKSSDFDSDSKQGQIVMRTSELFNTLSGKGYDVQVNFDNGESTNAILLGQQGGQVIITITDTNQPLRAFTSGNFEVNDENLKILNDIQSQISSL